MAALHVGGSGVGRCAIHTSGRALLRRLDSGWRVAYRDVAL